MERDPARSITKFSEKKQRVKRFPAESEGSRAERSLSEATSLVSINSFG